uniref:Golgin A1 n=1 Tax=Neolamprologus brichardi TaxID=32507 RepID=A0A3Q4GWC3_NEOBR
MFAKLKKKIAEEAATAPRSGVRIPRTISKESITSVGADSGDDFASDGSSSRDDLPAQLLRRNDQIRRLEAKLSDYAEQLRIMQKTKEKLEIALERHQDSSIKKLQEQNDSHQVSRAKMAEGMALALEKKDQEWMEKMANSDKEKAALSARLEETMEQSLALFQKRDDLDELEGFQQQELAKVKHMLLRKEELLSQQERDLQRKEKLKPESEAEAREKLPESRAEKPERVCPDPAPASTPSPPTSNTTVTNTSDLNDSREINFEYLKHVVLKFMSSREAEAYQLIRAVSVLLNFTREEEDMLKQTLEYKLLITAANNSIHNEVSFTSPWTERVLTEKEDPAPK